MQHVEVKREATDGHGRVVARSCRWIPRLLRPGSSLARRINQTAARVLDPGRRARLRALGGWLRTDEGMTLFYFAYRPACGGRVVEIGTFLGKSTAWMAAALKLAGACDRVVTIDPHRRIEAIREIYCTESLQEQCRRLGKATGLAPQDITTYELFLDNLAALELSSFIEPIRAPSQSAAESWTQPIRLLFIDGSHTYEDTRADLGAWEPWVNRGGIICLHDTKRDGPWQGVLRAMREHLMTDGRFRQLLYTGNLTVFEKLTPATGRGDRRPDGQR